MTDPAPPQETAPPAPPAAALIRWFWGTYLSHRTPLLLLALALMVVEGAMMAALSYLVKPMFDEVFVGGRSDAVIWVALSVAGVFVLRAVAGFSHRVLMARIGEGFVADMQADLLRHLMTLDLGFYLTHSPGSLIERVRGDSGMLRALWTTIVVTLGRDLVGFVSLMGVALWVDWRWTLVAVVGIPVVILPVVALQRAVRRSARAAREAAATLSSRLDEIFHGIVTVQLTGSERREGDRYRRDLNRYLATQVRSETMSAGIPGLIDVVAAIGFASVMAYGGYEIIGGTKTVGAFMSFFTAMALVFEPLRRLGGVSGTWAQARGSLERLRYLFDQTASVTAPANPAPLPERCDVVLQDVSFSYGGPAVLRGCSFTAEAGKTTALVGPSGAGKTTVFTLLGRVADPQGGRLTLGGADLRSLDLAALRGRLSMVSQQPVLFNETLRDNILMGAKGVSDARLAEVLEAANATEFVARLPQGLDTPAGPRGSALSGGQRQRIAIARAILRDAPILLLDEATSALDAQSEGLVAEALDRLSAGRTTLVIAHRLATVRQADKIVVLDHGSVVEEGTHESLLAKGGLYADLYRLQFKE